MIVLVSVSGPREDDFCRSQPSTSVAVQVRFGRADLPDDQCRKDLGPMKRHGGARPNDAPSWRRLPVVAMPNDVPLWKRRLPKTSNVHNVGVRPTNSSGIAAKRAAITGEVRVSDDNLPPGRSDEPLICPRCGSRRADFEQRAIRPGHSSATYRCLTCGRVWTNEWPETVDPLDLFLPE